MEKTWERGRDVIRRSLELLEEGEREKALHVLDAALLKAIEEKAANWVRILCRHASVIARIMGDHRRQLRYEEQALPYADDYRFAAYNFARLLLENGQVEPAKKYAAEAFQFNIAAGTDTDPDLASAILKLWPDLARQ